MTRAVFIKNYDNNDDVPDFLAVDDVLAMSTKNGTHLPDHIYTSNGLMFNVVSLELDMSNITVISSDSILLNITTLPLTYYYYRVCTVAAFLVIFHIYITNTSILHNIMIIIYDQ